jgi:hypothetical protein
MKGHKGYHHTHGTEGKINAFVAKHRASGGRLEEKGEDEAEKDIKDKPERYNKGKPEDEAEEMHAKKGGKVKKRKEGGKVEGEKAMCNGGRRPRRASGGGCEANPFTSANKGTPATGRKLEKETEGRDD